MRKAQGGGKPQSGADEQEQEGATILLSGQRPEKGGGMGVNFKLGVRDSVFAGSAIYKKIEPRKE